MQRRTPAAAIASATMQQLLSGRLLIASPALHDPNFARTVVLVGVHTEQGAMGVVLNRRSASTVGVAFGALAPRGEESAAVYVGGPVQPSAVVCLAEFLDPTRAGLLVQGRIGFPSPDEALAELAAQTERIRVFAGYAGWGEGQLEAEMESGDWIEQEPQPSDIFTDRPDELWGEVLRRMGGKYALLARMPLDPSVN